MSSLRKPPSRTPLIPPKPDYSPGWEWINNDKAISYAARKRDPNRHKRPTFVEFLKQVMLAGRYKSTHQGIAFNEYGELTDGQHRLDGVIEVCKILPNFGVWMLVTHGLPNDAMEAIDRGIGRTLADVIRIMTSLNVTHHEVAVAKQMMPKYRLTAKDRPADFEIQDFCVRHLTAIRFARRHTNYPRTQAAVIRAPVARADYCVDLERLDQFTKVLDSGMPESVADTAAITLRNLLLREPHVASRGAGLLEGYQKTVTALCAFLEGRPLTKLYATEEDPFALPEDQ